MLSKKFIYVVKYFFICCVHFGHMLSKTFHMLCNFLDNIYDICITYKRARRDSMVKHIV